MATKQPGVWGIDLGQSALKAVRLEMIEGQVTATAFDFIEHPKILSQPDADPDQLTRDALEQFLSRNDLKGDTVAISVPGQSGLARFVKLPPVEEKKIGDIVRFEAKQQIPFPLEEVVWDFQKIGAGTVSDGYALETEIGLFAMKRDMVNRALQQFRDVHVEVHIVQMAPLALCNFTSYELLNKGAGAEFTGSKECVVALDIGCDNSNLVITDGEKIIWQRPIPLGGNHFTRALTKELKLTFAKAEHVKRNAIKSPDLRKILAALRPVLNDFVNEVQRSLGYFTNTHRDANIMYMVGLGNAFRLPGLQKFLQEKLGLEVRKLASLDRLQGDEVVKAPQFTENVLSFAVAYGLSLQGLGLTRLQTNLLPQEIRTERMIRAKKPWAVAAAALLLLGVASLTFGRSVQYASYVNPDVQKAQKLAGDVVTKVGGVITEYKNLEDKAKESEVAVNRIASGVDERFNWNLVYKYIDDVLPNPDPQNPRIAEQTEQNDFPRQKYLTEAARDAYQKWLKKQDPHEDNQDEERDLVQEAKDNEEIKKNLIQINIEGVDCLYSDNLEPFFKNILTDTKGNLYGMNKYEQHYITTDKEKLPKSGWVFAIRGYTYHWDEKNFVMNTLLENLRRPEARGVAIPLSKEMKDRVIKNLGYFVLYSAEKVTNPQPGMLAYVKTSPLRKLLAAPQAAGGYGSAPGSPAAMAPQPMDAPPGGAPGTPEAGAAPSRDAWVPLGDVAMKALGGASAGGPPGMAGAENYPMNTPPPGDAAPMGTPEQPGQPGQPRRAASDIERQARVEFVILFVWREPTTLDGAVEAAPDAAAPME